VTEAFDRFRLDGRTAVVTGIGPGIGEHVARAFASVGANVVLCARTPAKLAALAADLTSAGARALAVPADISKDDQLEALIQSVTTEFGGADIIFNNAFASATHMGRPELDLTRADFDLCTAANLWAPFRLTQAFAPWMRDVGYGSVINVLSTAGFTPIPGIAATAYGATKAGLAMLTRYLAKALAPTIRVNALCPGTITPEGTGIPEQQESVRNVPLGRFGLAAEVVPAALLLASPASSYMTGQILFVDGGRVATVA
jgi:gluconate 5-dehydrogenase/7-alpha-hydroxysteroid dehydrogenase